LANEVAAASDRGALAREIWIASVGIVVALGVLKHLAPIVGDHAYTAAAALQLYVPVYLIGRRGIRREDLGLQAKHWRRDLGIAVILGIATVVPFAIGHHLWQTLLFHRRWAPRLPSGLLESALTQVLVVALPEELFFRGYLQRRMELLWPAARRIFGAPFGLAIVSASAVFALAHFAGEYRPDRLGPFFPALVFGLLRTRTGSLVAPIAYHAICNLIGDVLWACYRS
jgi:hypothetical protein